MGRRWRSVDKPSLMISQELRLSLNSSVISLDKGFFDVINWICFFCVCRLDKFIGPCPTPHKHLESDFNKRQDFRQVVAKFPSESCSHGDNGIKRGRKRRLQTRSSKSMLWQVLCNSMCFDVFWFLKNAKNVRLRLRSDVGFVLFFASTQLCAPHITFRFFVSNLLFSCIFDIKLTTIWGRRRWASCHGGSNHGGPEPTGGNHFPEECRQEEEVPGGWAQSSRGTFCPSV